MSDLKLQQGETTDITITLSEPLKADMILYYAISKSKRVLLSGNTKTGGVQKLDDRHYLVHLTSDETAQLSTCELELAYGKEGKSIVNIGEQALSLEFAHNNIKTTLL